MDKENIKPEEKLKEEEKHEHHSHNKEKKNCCGDCKNGIEGGCNSIKKTFEKIEQDSK